QSILFSWSEMVRSQKHPGHGFEEALDKVERPLLSIHFKEESISLCHPERSEGSLSGERSFAALRMTILNRLRLIRKTSSLKWIGACLCPGKDPPNQPNSNDSTVYRCGPPHGY